MPNTLAATCSNINRGELYFVNLDPIKGSEQGGIRPVMIVQNNMGNRHSPTTIVVPITSQRKKKLPTHLLLPELRGLEEGSMALCEQLRTLDKSRLGKYIGQVMPQTLGQIDICLSISLGLSSSQKVSSLMTLCKGCADAYRDTKLYVLGRPNVGTRIKEPCMICSRPGFDYEVTRRA